MDRREALKKLGVGSAVAVGVPVLLDAFNVAHACSVASAAAAVTNRPVINSNNIPIDFNVSAFNCTTTPTFTWRIISSNPLIEPITTTGPSALIKKLVPSGGNPANFTIEVDVRDASNNLIATYELLGSPTSPLAVALLP